MADVGCCEAMRVLNAVFDERVIGKYTDEIVMRLEAEESMAAMLIDFGDKFSQYPRVTRSKLVERVVTNWPADQGEMVRQAVLWALKQRQKGVPIKIHWNGDDENPETITQIQLKGNEIFIEFAHPPHEEHSAEYVAQLTA